MLLVVTGEQGGAVLVHRHEVQPVARLRAFGRSQRVIPGRADGCRRQTGHGVGVPRGLGFAIGVSGGDLLADQWVIHRRIELESVVITAEPVIDDAGHFGEVDGFGFLLHQRRDNQDFVGRYVHRFGGFEESARDVVITALGDERGQDLLGRRRRIDVPGAGGDQAFEAAMAVTHDASALDGPIRHVQ